MRNPMPLMSDEKRGDERHVVLVKVALRDEARLRHLYATNLSKGGLFLATKASLPIGQGVALELIHPITAASYEVAAEVVNVRRGSDGTVRGCGLKFTTFDEDVKEALFLFVQGVVDMEDDVEEAPFREPEAPEEVAEPPHRDGPSKRRAQAFLQRALLLEKEGNLVGAAHLLARATSIDPAEDSLWSNLRRIEAELEAATGPRGYTEAVTTSSKTTLPVRSSPLAEPEDPGVLELDEKAALEPADRRKARLLFEAARDCYRTEDVDEAMAYLERALGADPTYPPPYYALAGMLAEKGVDVDRSLFLCRKAVELDPGNEVYLEALRSLETGDAD